MLYIMLALVNPVSFRRNYPLRRSIAEIAFLESPLHCSEPSDWLNPTLNAVKQETRSLKLWSSTFTESQFTTVA